MSALSLFGCILYCKAVTLCLFSIVIADLDVDFAVPCLSSNVQFYHACFNKVFTFHA
jgi:hypothetical protein